MESQRKKIIFLLFFTFLYSFSLQTGDIVLRKEKNLLSDIFSQIDYCGYSHSGIIVKLNKQLFVCNIEYKQKNNLEITPYSKFIQNASKIVILRPTFPFDKTKLKNFILNLKKANPKFDLNFSLKNNKFYCTELIDFVYFNIANRHIYKYLYNFKNKKIITIKSIYSNPALKQIKTITY
jgi:hypothetical protein